MSEAELQRSVIELARLLGWRVYHTRDSRGSAAGFPDLCMVRAGDLIFAELKTEKGKLSPAQCEWWALLGRVAERCAYCDHYANEFPTEPPEHGVRSFVWRPAEWLDGTIETILRTKGTA